VLLVMRRIIIRSPVSIPFLSRDCRKQISRVLKEYFYVFRPTASAMPAIATDVSVAWSVFCPSVALVRPA